MKYFNFNKTFILFIMLVVGGFFVSECYVEARSYSRSSSRSYSRSSSSSSRSSSWGSKKSTSKKSTTSSSWGKKKNTSSKKSSTYGSTGKKSNAQKAKDKAIMAKQRKAAATSAANKRRTIMTKKKAANNKARVRQTKAKVAGTTKADWKSKRSSYMKDKKTYKPKRNEKTKYTGSQRTTVINNYNNGYGGYYYNDPFNHMMIWSFSTMWWYHHWNMIDRSHYQDDARMREMEMEIQRLKAQGIQQNPSYVDEGMDETVMYGDGYLEGIQNGTITEANYKVTTPAPVVVKEKSNLLGWGLAFIIVFSVIGIVIWRFSVNDKR